MDEKASIHGLNLANGSDEDCLETKLAEGGDFISNPPQGVEGIFSLQLDSSIRSNVEYSSQNFPARFSDESPFSVFDFSDPNDHQIRSLLSGLSVKSVEHNTLERTQESAAQAYQIDNLDSNVEVEISREKLNLSDGSDEDCLERALAECVRNGDLILTSGQGLQPPLNGFQQDLSFVSNVLPLTKHFPAGLFQASAVCDFSDPSDEQKRSSSSSMTMNYAQHHILERTDESAAKVYQIDNLETNMEVEVPRDRFNLSDGSDEDRLQETLAEYERIGDAIFNIGQGLERPCNGVQQDFSTASNVPPWSQHFPAGLSHEATSVVSHFSDPNDEQKRSLSSGMTVNSAQQNMLERTHESAAKTDQIDNLESNMEVEIPREKFNLSEGSDEDGLGKSLAEWERNVDVNLDVGHDLEGPLSGFQHEIFILSNVLPWNQHLPAGLSQGATSPFSHVSDPIDEQIWSLPPGLTGRSSEEHNTLEWTAAKAHEIDNLDSTKEVEIQRDKLNVSDSSDEDWLDKALEECERNGDLRKERRHLEAPLNGFEQDLSFVSNAVPASQHCLSGLSKDSTSPFLDFSDEANMMLESTVEVDVDFLIPMLDPEASNTTTAPRLVCEAVPHFQSDLSGNSPPQISNLALPPDSSEESPFRPSGVTTVSCEPHSDFPSFVRLQSPKIKLHYPIASSPTTKRYRTIEPKLINHKRAAEKDPLEIATEDICKNLMKRVPIRAVDGLVEKLTRVIDSHKRCRDERKPIHIRPECAFMEDPTAIDCCWTGKFGGSFPDGNSIMESIHQIVTKIVVQAMKDRDKVLSHGSVKNRCDEWFKLHTDVGPSRTELQLRGKAKTDAMTVLAKSLGIKVDQVAKRWATYRQKVSRERLSKKRRMERPDGETQKICYERDKKRVEGPAEPT